MPSCEYYASKILSLLHEHGYEAYYAGGCVRDYLLGASYTDIDIASSATPEDIKKIFRHTNCVGEHFGVVIVMMGGMSFEVASFRHDGSYSDGRHPDSVCFTNAQEDAKRRDFTINGMFYNPFTQSVIDYVRGQQDIHAKCIRSIGDPYKRFSEDKLRMLRAIRFASKLRFDIDTHTWQALCHLSPAIHQVSQERVRDELLKIFAHGNDFRRAMGFLYDSGLLKEIMPELFQLQSVFPREIHDEKESLYESTLKMLDFLECTTVELLFSVLFFYVFRCGDRDIAGTLYARFRLSSSEKYLVASMLSQSVRFDSVLQMSQSELKRFLRQDGFQMHLRLYKIYCLGAGRSLVYYDFCVDRLMQWEDELSPKPLLNGRDLLRLGFAPGPLLKRILTDLENAQLEHKISSASDALAYVEQYYLCCSAFFSPFSLHFLIRLMKVLG